MYCIFEWASAQHISFIIYHVCVSCCRSNVTQTRKEGGTSVPKPSVYIAGLRGKDTVPEKIDLTLSVDTHNNISA